MEQFYGYQRVSSIQQVEGNSLERKGSRFKPTQPRRDGIFHTIASLLKPVLADQLTFKGDRKVRTARLSCSWGYDHLCKVRPSIPQCSNAFATLQQLKDLGINVHFIDLGGEVTGSGIGAVIFGVMSVFANFEKDRIASRIREVKQMQKAQGRFVGGRRAFGYNIVDGQKVQREDEQRVIVHMQEQRLSGKSYRSIANWLKSNTNFDLSCMGVREVLGKQPCSA